MNWTCPSCEQQVNIEEEDILSINGQVVHKQCFFEDVEQ
jgi:hypothetical protein